MGRMASRHSWQTGRREILTRGVPQMRQSEGNKTAKRLSAIWPVQSRLPQLRPTWTSLWTSLWISLFTLPLWIWPLLEATVGPATAALAWLARILSPVLLKTASVTPAGLWLRRAAVRLPAGIEY